MKKPKNIYITLSECIDSFPMTFFNDKEIVNRLLTDIVLGDIADYIRETLGCRLTENLDNTMEQVVQEDMGI